MVSPPAPTATTSTMRSLTLGRTQRSYLVVAPGDQHTALPLVMILHGRSVTVQQEEIRTDFLFLAQQGKAVLVYPVGYGQSWNADGGCCGDAATAQLDDSAFLAAVTGDVANHFSINGSRSYLVGYSNGARMAFTEVCAHPSLFAAFAVYGAVPTDTCADTSIAVPALISAGTADPELATTNPAQTTTQVIESVVADWRARDRCETTSTATPLTPAQLTVWAHCRNGAAVESLLYLGVNHSWPRATQADPPSNTAVGASAGAATLMWNFLSAHQSPQS
ncbi:MAG: dienelactone hydrolase family protein [Pseudonocardiales bacterium]|nr:dienelactone hydrolase family protein [Pseudonocardiales bacterium]